MTLVILPPPVDKSVKLPAPQAGDVALNAGNRKSQAEHVQQIYRELSIEVDRLAFGRPVTHVYNPLDYAWPAVMRYLDMATGHGSQVMFLGMNPGPWGMAQTGVPFGTVSLVRDWLGIDEPVGRPKTEHPKRPVTGFATSREEVSGQRFWGWARDRYGCAEYFFARFFVANYCPLVFMESTGRNRTPDKLPPAERKPLFAACDRALQAVVEVLQPTRIVGVGKFAEDRARALFAAGGPAIGRVLHPSPASPIANRGWAEQAEQQLLQQGVVAARE